MRYGSARRLGLQRRPSRGVRLSRSSAALHPGQAGLFAQVVGPGAAAAPAANARQSPPPGRWAVVEAPPGRVPGSSDVAGAVVRWRRRSTHLEPVVAHHRLPVRSEQLTLPVPVAQAHRLSASWPAWRSRRKALHRTSKPQCASHQRLHRHSRFAQPGPARRRPNRAASCSRGLRRAPAAPGRPAHASAPSAR